MEIRTQEYYHGVVMEIRGRYIGCKGGEAFRRALDELRRVGKNRVVLDLAHTDVMDSTALGLIIHARAEMQQAGGDLRLAGLDQRIRHLFLMTHLLGPVFEDYPTREQALASYRDERTGLPVN